MFFIYLGFFLIATSLFNNHQNQYGIAVVALGVLVFIVDNITSSMQPRIIRTHTCGAGQPEACDGGCDGGCDCDPFNGQR